MSQKLISLRVELSKRLADAQVVGRSRELSLAVTSIQSARMLFGSVALALGSTNPYPEADKPASAVIHPSADLAVDYLPPVVSPLNQVGGVKGLRVDMQVAIDAAVALRSELWARPYASAISITAEVLFDRALVELFIAKQWLGEQLAVLAGHQLVKMAPAPKAGFDWDAFKAEADAVWKAREALFMKWINEAIPATAKQILIDIAEGKEPAKAPEQLPQKAQEGTKAEAEVGGVTQRSEEGAQSVTEGGPSVVTSAATSEVPADGERVETLDELIAAKLKGGVAITEICRELDVTEHRVKKIKKALPAAEASAVTGAATAEVPAMDLPTAGG